MLGLTGDADQDPKGCGKEFEVCPLLGYEAEITGSDVIIGHPYLRMFRLVVDCPENCLQESAKATPTSHSIQRMDGCVRESDESVVHTDNQGGKVSHNVFHNCPLVGVPLVPPGSKVSPGKGC